MASKLALTGASLALMFLVAACGLIREEAPQAASRFATAIEQIATRLGKPASEVESKIKIRMPNATIDDLATQAERTANETATLERLAAAQAAAAAERQKTFVAIHDATCDLIDLIEDTSEAQTDDELAEAFANAIVGRMQDQELDLTVEKAGAIWDAVLRQYDVLSQGGQVDPTSVAIDLACL